MSAGAAWTYDAHDVTKVYPGTTALHGVSFSARPGDVHALIGENGAGKSTLVKILAGVERPTTGRLELDGRPLAFASVREAAAAGIGLIHQELQLFPDLSVAENLFIGRERLTRWGSVDTAAHEREARAALARLGQDVDPHALVRTLPLGLRQVVEIARALVARTRVLMMDEPTSALAAGEVEALFRVIRDLAAHGVAIVYISHHLHELLAIADRITVLRDGTVVGASAAADVDVPWIVERMTGRPPHAKRSASTAGAGPTGSTGPVVLDARDLSLPPRSGRTALDRVSLQLRGGEVCGIYGLLGAGRTELFETLLGVHPDAQGQVSIDGRPLDHRDVADRVAAGLAMVPEDRQTAGLVPSMTVQQNMTLAHLAAFAPHGALNAAAERRASEALASTLRVRTPSLDAPVVALSGGNQQKVVIARGVMPKPRVLLLDDPTRGVDVAAKAEILATMRSLAADGMAVAFASSDLAEIVDAADRVLVMARGRLRAEFAAVDVTEEKLTAAASSAASSDVTRRDAVH
jgi:erythritol transport system ATP-binding protein